MSSRTIHLNVVVLGCTQHIYIMCFCLTNICFSCGHRIDWNPPGDVIVPLIFSDHVHADGFVKLNLSALGHVADLGSGLSYVQGVVMFWEIFPLLFGIFEICFFGCCVQDCFV